MSIRFIHTADLHLGATFKGLVSSSEVLSEALTSAVGQTFAAIVDLALREQVDFIIIAGDIFDAPQIPYGLQQEFKRQLTRLGEQKIAAYLVTGNHDPLSGWGSLAQTLPDNTTLFPSGAVTRVEYLHNGEAVAALYGYSYHDRIERGDIASLMHAEEGDPLSIGVLHTSVGGAEPYAPSGLTTLKGAGMDYWALGHIHRTEVLSEAPPVVYAGSPQGLNINENTEHGCYLVELGAGAPSVEFVPTARIHWEQLTINCEPFAHPEELQAHLVACANNLVASRGGHVCARITLTGRSPLHTKLQEPGLLSDMQQEIWGECGVGATWFWLDRIIDQTSPMIDEAQIKASGMFAATFLQEVAALAHDSAARQDITNELTEDLYTYYGKGAKTIVDQIPFENLIEQAKTHVLDELLGEGK